MIRILRWMAVTAFAIVVVRSAWLSDDAYITLRTVRNFVAGDGLRWNLAERVQSYTHPLWAFALAAIYAVTREAYFSTLALSFAMSLAAVGIVAWRVVPSPWSAVVVVLTLASSRSYVDYSTSGLENPLTHVLLALCVGSYLHHVQPTPRDLRRLALLAALAVVNRVDTVLLVGSMLAAAWLRAPSWRGVRAIVVGLTPLWAWELFSVVYYGFPQPNTANAKLPASISAGARVSQGLDYLSSTWAFDRVVVLVMVAGVLAPLVLRRWRLAPLSAAIVLYATYIVYVGGDFMAGRFFTAPFLIAGISLAHGVDGIRAPAWAQRIPSPIRFGLRLVPAVAVVAIGLSHGARSTFRTDADFGVANHAWHQCVDAHGVADEREVYFRDLGLLRTGGRLAGPRHRWLDRGRTLAPGSVSTAPNVGLLGWAAPRTAHIIDTLALTDPLLARLPPIPVRHWRPGHLGRKVPDGYIATLETGVDHFTDRALGRYAADLARVTRGPLWTRERWAAIWRLNTDGDNHLLAAAQP